MKRRILIAFAVTAIVDAADNAYLNWSKLDY
jgi:hypothetical protein